MRRAAAGSAAGVLVALIATASALADSSAAEGRFYFQRASEAYARGRYAAALDAFLLAHEATPNPRTLFNVARSAERAGETVLAYSSFEVLAGDEGLDAAQRADAIERRDALGTELAVLRVVTDPPGATLFLDRRDRGVSGVSPVRLPLRAAGTVRVIAEHPGHRRAEREVAVAIGAVAEVQLTLEPRVGALALAVEPAQARVELRPVEGGPTVFAREGSIPVGVYRAVATAPEYREARAEVRVREGETTELRLTLAPLPRPTGRLLVNGPAGTEVRVDGRVVGTAPVGLSVAVGTHVVQLGSSGREHAVEVREETRAYVDLREAAPTTSSR
ncbi:MAG: PEGA domain-containing protein [Myxococcota bacterium]